MRKSGCPYGFPVGYTKERKYRMDSEKDIIEFWPKLREIIFSYLPNSTSTYYFSKTNVVEYDFKNSTLVVICTNTFVFGFFCREKEKIEKAYFDAFHLNIHVELLEMAEQVDPSVYINRIVEEEKRKEAEKEKERLEAQQMLRQHHPEYFRDYKKPEDNYNSYISDLKAEREKNTVESDADRARKEREEYTDFVEIEVDGKKLRLGSSMPASNPNYTFDTFLEGESNKFAKAACLAVANKPAAGYNPLFIYGPSGLGKTHLLYAITSRIKQLYPEKKIMYITCEQFTNQMVQCIQLNAMQEFRELFRTRDVLLIDDIQFIEGKPSTQEEMFHTINAMIDNCQMIFTSDRTPNDMKKLEERLRTRFEWGLLADIQPPDLELRIAIFKNKAEESGLRISDEVILFLAENLRSNVRQIEGAIKRFSARAFLMGRNGEIDMEYAKSCLPDLLGNDEPVSVTVDKVFAAVYEKYGISRESLVSSSRTKDIAYARKIAVFLIKKKCGLSVTSISHMFGRDHSTITALLNDISAKQMTDARVMSDLNDFYGKLKIVK